MPPTSDAGVRSTSVAHPSAAAAATRRPSALSTSSGGRGPRPVAWGTGTGTDPVGDGSAPTDRHAGAGELGGERAGARDAHEIALAGHALDGHDRRREVTGPRELPAMASGMTVTGTPSRASSSAPMRAPGRFGRVSAIRAPCPAAGGPTPR